MTTSSPGCQRVTPSPTFHTMPEASEPPMWWSSGWERKTETGWPRAAHTLLKFTPAAITRTVTSKAPGSGTSISSTWNASSGSPWRSSRITHAAIVGGSSPGSTSSWATCFVSIATDSPDSGRAEDMPSEPVLALDPEQRADQQRRDDQRADPVDQEVVLRVDVVHQPAEVLAEEPRHERPHEEERAADRQPRRDRVQPVRVGVEVGRGERGQVLLLAVQLAGDLGEVVADVAQVLARAAGEAGQVEDDLGAGGEAVALGHDPAGQLLDVLLEAVDLRQLLLTRAGEQDLGLERVDALLEQLDDRVEGVGQDVEDLVDDVVLGLRVGDVELLVQRVELDARRAAHRDDERARDVDVDLDGLEQPLARAAPAPHRVEDEQDAVAVGVELGPLAELARVLERDRVQPEEVAERGEVLVAGVGEVEPEELVALAQRGEAVGIDALEHLHCAASLSRDLTVQGR